MAQARLDMQCSPSRYVADGARSRHFKEAARLYGNITLIRSVANSEAGRRRAKRPAYSFFRLTVAAARMP